MDVVVRIRGTQDSIRIRGVMVNDGLFDNYSFRVACADGTAHRVPLIIGTNLGGMGTLIASMASLIGYKNVTRKYPDKKGRYLAVYSAVNVLFLIVLVGLSWIIEP